MKHCFGYTRVSTAKQGEGVSLDAQKEAIQAFAAGHNLLIVKWFEEKETAAKKGRPIFTRMLKELRQGKARGLVIHKIDRSARNFADWAKIGELADAGIDVHFATESLDFNSRGGRLTADIQAVIAADYIRNLRDETIKGIKGRLKQGLYPFRAPVGYLDQGAGKPKIPDPEKAPLIRRLFERYATGEASINSLQAEMLVEGLRNHYGRPVSTTGIETILNNSFYCGLIHIKRTGQTYNGIHEPIISASLFKLVQDVKSGRHVGKKVTRHNHTFRGMFRCTHCQTAAIAERQKGHVYYRCHTPGCATKTVREELLDDGIAQALQRTSLSNSMVEKLGERLRQWLQQKSEQPADDTVQMRINLVEARLNKLTDALLDELIDQDVFNQKREALLLEQANLKEEKAERLVRPSLTVDRIDKFLELMESLYLTYLFADPAEKREIAQLTTSNRSIAGKSVFVEPHHWLVQASNTMDTLSGAPYTGSSRRSREVTDRCIEQLTKLMHSQEVSDLSKLL
ncbi:MAG: recombinase family protein [Pseudomonadota bacterium]